MHGIYTKFYLIVSCDHAIWRIHLWHHYSESIMQKWYNCNFVGVLSTSEGNCYKIWSELFLLLRPKWYKLDNEHVIKDFCSNHGLLSLGTDDLESILTLLFSVSWLTGYWFHGESYKGETRIDNDMLPCHSFGRCLFHSIITRIFFLLMIEWFDIWCFSPWGTFLS